MTDTPLRANPEDRPLPPSGGTLPASPSGGATPADAAATAPDAKAAGPVRPSAAPEKAPRKPAATNLRPIGRLAPPPRDWRRAWAGFLIGVAVLLVAVGLAMVLWDLADVRIAQAPVEPLPPIDLAELEALLDNLGFPPGEIDGMIDADTRAAIRDFQATAGLTVDGRPSAELLEELRAAHLELTGGQ
jgi:hypothetical protein